MSRLAESVLLCIMFVGWSVTGVGCVEVVPPNVDAGAVPPQVRFLAAGIADARAKFRCGQAIVTYYSISYKEWFLALQAANHVPPGVLGKDTDDVEIRTCYWHCRVPALATDIIDAGPTGAVLSRKQLVTSGDSVRRLTTQHYPGTKQPPTLQGVVLTQDTGLQNGLQKDDPLMDPRSYAFFLGARPLDQLLLDKREHASFQGEETLDASRCMKIQTTHGLETRTVYWIDVQHGFVVRRIERYSRVNGEDVLRMRQEALRLSESGGVWLPTAIESRLFLPKKLLPQYRDIPDWTTPFTGVCSLVTISRFSTELEPGLSSAFSLPWPRGTMVQDTVTGKNYVQGAEPRANGLKGDPQRQKTTRGGLTP